MERPEGTAAFEQQYPPTGEPANAQTRTAAGTLSGAAGEEPEVDVVIGQTIGRYQVRRLLGRGGMGRVYLARDIVLGRSVALKVVSGSVHTERFLDEARAIAMLNHPNIVQLYDFGEHDRGIYLALEYIEGDTLRDRIRRGRIELDDALRYTYAIADALAHAHAAQAGSRRGVFHCDLKPSNVIVGRDGRVRVVDFGIASIADDPGESGAGSPDWMAPEQWNALPLTDRVDVWALAIVCAQLVTGRHPLGDDVALRHQVARDPRGAWEIVLEPRDLPGPVADLIARALVHDPVLRPSAAEWARVLDGVINSRGDGSAEESPYPGLTAFAEQHARLFFGRERDIDEFLERLRDAPCLPIVGPSGAGKSSFLHAGVIPRLRRRERWTVLAFRPGADPIGALAGCMTAAATGAFDGGGDRPRRSQHRAEVEGLRAALIDQPGLLAVRLATLAAACSNRVLLAVDQLEEVFTQCPSEVERQQFVTMLLTAADDPLEPVRVVFTVRDDFLGRIAGLRSLFVMRKLATDDLRRTITGPLTRLGYEFDDPRIVDDLVAEVGSAEVADLPLLQFACRTLWDGRDVATRRLWRATYIRMGGLAGALARHAERALAEMTLEERRTARRILLRLVSGTTRRTLARDRLVELAGAGAGAVLERLVSARLVVQRTTLDGEDVNVEIAHESLLQTWGQLARWVDESRDERRLGDELDVAAALWQGRGRRSDETWSADDIVAVRRRAAQLEFALPAPVEDFLRAGEARHRRIRRRRRARYGIALATAAVTIVGGAVAVGRYLAREHRIRINAGTIDLVIRPFDWTAGSETPVPLDQLPDLAWRLHAIKPGDPNALGDLIPQDLVEIVSSSVAGPQRTDRISAPGGAAFLEITGRGRGGEQCPPSWIRIAAFPGYAGAAAPRVLELAVPTCQASRADVIDVPAGEFIYGGPGEPRSEKYGEADYTIPEQRLFLAAYAMDRTEVSNRAFAPFARLAAITGYPAPIYSNDPVHAHDADPDRPVTEIDAHEAAAFCRYMGKALPTDRQWVKAARGGVDLDGAPNPYPRRLYPWGVTPHPECVNQDGDQDGYEWVAPVESYRCGASPYGFLNLVGNVQEAISRDDQPDPDNPQHVIRGGGASSPPDLEHVTTIFINHRDPRAFGYSIGLRCVSDH